MTGADGSFRTNVLTGPTRMTLVFDYSQQVPGLPDGFRLTGNLELMQDRALDITLPPSHERAAHPGSLGQLAHRRPGRQHSCGQAAPLSGDGTNPTVASLGALRMAVLIDAPPRCQRRRPSEGSPPNTARRERPDRRDR